MTMVTLAQLLGNGYFPKELPPPFSTSLFGSLMQGSGVQIPSAFNSQNRNNVVSKPAIHNLARVGTLRRQLSIQNPINYYQLCELIESEWLTLNAKCMLSPLSISKPIVDTSGRRALTRLEPFRRRSHFRAQTRATSRYILQTDLASFYSTIYTHSISWALHSKTIAKANRAANALLGNRIDSRVRNGQDMQTNGIPVGPDTSVVISEVILASVDQELSTLLNTNGFRYVDDYELGFQSYSEAENALATLQGVLNTYQLQLNASKTVILELPTLLDSSWASELRNFRFQKRGRGQLYDLYSYFNRAFELANEHPRNSVLSYAIRRLNSVLMDPVNWGDYQNLLFQCAMNEPGSLHNIIDQLLRYFRNTYTINSAQFRTVLGYLMQKHAPLGHGSEVAWALWGTLLFSISIDESIASIISRMDDPVVALLALDARNKGLITSTPSFSQWESKMNAQELYDDQWLLAYEANVKGWLPVPPGPDYVNSDPAFSFLKSNSVQFYDDTISSSYQPKSPIVSSTQYGRTKTDCEEESENEEDYEGEY